jgi:Tol biopolymer transport system component
VAIRLALAQTGDDLEGSADGNPQIVERIAPSEPRIAYVSDLEDDVGINLMDTDGSTSRRLSSDEGFHSDPAWSPDGWYVAYEGAEDSIFGRGEAFVEIWVSAIEGSERFTVSRAISNVMTTRPAWSPDGVELAFLSVGESEEGDPHAIVNIVHSDGSGIIETIPLPWMTYELNWSRTANALLLAGEIEDNEWNVYALPLDEDDGESQPTELFSGALAADWSPDGEKVVVGDYSSNKILIIAEGQEPNLVAQLNLQPVEIAWSPEGAHMAVTTAANYRQGYGTNLYLIEVETGEFADISQGQGWVVEPSWSPDGSQLLFTMGPMVRRTGSDLPYADLWVYDIASSGLTQLTAGGGFEGLGVWSP